MESLIIEPTKSSPFVSFDPASGILEIKGESYPENAAKFYAPVFDWLESYLASPSDRRIEVNLEIVYFNSSSSKVFMNLLEVLKQAASRGQDIVVNWRYHEENEVALECGEEFMEDLEGLAFNLVEIRED